MQRWLFGLLAALTAGPAVAADPAVRLLVPAYFYPAGKGVKEWERLISTATKAPVVVIVNPDSGPGKNGDPNYSALVEQMAAAKIDMVGYVTLGYAKRPMADVKADVDQWKKLYPDVGGVFFDELPSVKHQAAFAAEAFAYVREKRPTGHLLANPGTNCDRSYLDAKGDATLCLYEGKDAFAKWQPPAWAKRERTCVLVYGVAKADWPGVYDRAKAKAAWLLVTDAGEKAPWEQLPTYWEELVAAAKKEK